MNSNITKGLVLAALLAQFAAPTAFAFGEASSAGTPPRGQDAQARFCTRLSTFGTKMDEGMYGREVKIRTARDQQKMTIESRWNERDAKLAEARTAREDNINEHFSKIESRDLTDEQKTALDAFKKAYEAARLARKTAVDAALADYREHASTTVTLHQSSIDSLIATFKAAVVAAEDTAKSDCASGIDPQTVRTTLMESLQAARDALKSGREALDTRGDALKPLIEERNSAIRAASEDFKAAMEKARADLKAAFPKN